MPPEIEMPISEQDCDFVYLNEMLKILKNNQ